MSKLGDAHNSCKEAAIKAVTDQNHVVIIDNTNIKLWEMKFYLELAEKFNYVPIQVEPKTPWKKDVAILSKRNKHNVDEKTISIKVMNKEASLIILKIIFP